MNKVFFTNSGSEVGRDRAEDRPRLPPRARRRRAHPAHRPRARLPRRQLRRHLGRRHGRQPQDVRHACWAASTTSATPTTRRATPSRVGQPEHGAELADDLERLVALHDASTIAAVIVEPVAGSTGVLMPPKGYLQRLREICDKHGILLIFDEVITGFGRTGKPFAAQTFGVTPDMMTLAKGLTNGCVPMGAVLAKHDPRRLHDRARAPDRVLPRLHLFRPPAGLRRRPRHAGHLCRRRPARPAPAKLQGYFAEARAFAQGRAQRDRHPQHRPGRRHRAGADRRASRPSARSTSSSTATTRAC